MLDRAEEREGVKGMCDAAAYATRLDRSGGVTGERRARRMAARTSVVSKARAKDDEGGDEGEEEEEDASPSAARDTEEDDDDGDDDDDDDDVVNDCTTFGNSEAIMTLMRRSFIESMPPVP